jgi:hypothetical protein
MVKISVALLKISIPGDLHLNFKLSCSTILINAGFSSILAFLALTALLTDIKFIPTVDQSAHWSAGRIST